MRQIASEIKNRFRPLSENYISQSGIRTEKRDEFQRFPSPVGELHFSIRPSSLIRKLRTFVSVPCRGTTFLNDGGKYEKIRRNYFRPLSGNYISQCSLKLSKKHSRQQISVPCRGTTFLNDKQEAYKPLWKLFPSPVGELHFSIIRVKYDAEVVKNISVPCRGTTFLNNGIINL